MVAVKTILGRKWLKKLLVDSLCLWRNVFCWCSRFQLILLHVVVNLSGSLASGHSPGIVAPPDCMCQSCPNYPLVMDSLALLLTYFACCFFMRPKWEWVKGIDPEHVSKDETMQVRF